MKLRLLSMALAGVLLLAGCGGGADRLASAAQTADSVVSVNRNANVEVNAEGTGLDVTFRMNNPLVHVDAIGPQLFDAYASQVLKTYPAKVVTEVCRAMQEAKGELRVEIENTGLQESKVFTLSGRRVLDLHRAGLSALDPGAVREQLVKVAELMVPGGKANDGCVRVETSVSKGFLEYNIVWPDAKAFDGKDQGLLTARYMAALRADFKSLGEQGPEFVDFLGKVGIDGVRMVYTAEGSDVSIRQAFPWREIMKNE